MSVKKAVLPVAGLGTRVLPATKSTPKEMLPVVDQPAIQYVVDEIIEAGIEHIVFVTGRGKSVIEDHFDSAFELEAILKEKNKLDLLERVRAVRLPAGGTSFTRQQEPLGLGHAVWCARSIIGKEPFAVLLPDVLIKAAPSCLAQMIKVYEEVGGNLIAVDEIPKDQVSSYGVIAPKGDASDDVIEMSGMVEKPLTENAPSNLKITGRYILQPEIFGLLEDQAKGAGGEIQLTDAMARLMQTQSFNAYRYTGRDFDCGSRPGYFEAVVAYALDHPEMGETAKTIIQNALQETD